MGTLAGIVYILVHAQWDVTLENSFKGAFLWILLGVSISLLNHLDPANDRKVIPVSGHRKPPWAKASGHDILRPTTVKDPPEKIGVP